MDAITIIYIVIALLVGGACVFFITRKSKSQLSELQTENDSLKKKVSEFEDNLRHVEAESVQKCEGMKAQYKSLLDEANGQCEKLDKQLKNLMDGKLDETVKEQLAEAEKLKKKIKDLEEELEENEDDIADLKKKVRTKDDDISELQDNLGKEKKVSKELQEELSSVKSELDEKVEELNLKMGSLDFIQEILSAPDSNREDIKALYENIAELKSFTQDQLMDCYATLKDNHIEFGGGDFKTYREEWNRRFDEWASVTRKSWINGKTTIAFVGEFSAGKTSIVNRILSQDNPKVPQLPVSTKATTAIPTYIAGGPAVTYQFVTPDDKLKAISEQTFTEKVSKEVLDQIKGVSSLIQYFVMTYKNPNLDGLSILDTPGFNSNDENDAQRTMEVINECDALFWVFDVNAGTVNRSSISIIKDYLNKPLYVVINKVDTKADSEVQKVESLIKSTLSENGLNVEQFIRFSAKVPLADIMNPIKSVQHLGEKERYLADLGDNIDGILKILNDEVKETERKYRQADSNGNRINDKFVQQMKVLWERCNTAAGIPHFEEHLFRKDGYEMSIEEYNRLTNVLDSCINDVNNMAKIYDEKTDSAYTAQNAWEEHLNAKAAWQKVNEMKVQFNKIVKKF